VLLDPNPWDVKKEGVLCFQTESTPPPEGKEPHQGVGYLEDGSMVVVDEGIRYKGQEIEVVITQAIQTQVGRLFFARPAQ